MVTKRHYSTVCLYQTLKCKVSGGMFDEEMKDKDVSDDGKYS